MLKVYLMCDLTEGTKINGDGRTIEAELTMEQNFSTKTFTFDINKVIFNGKISTGLDEVLNGLYSNSGSDNNNN